MNANVMRLSRTEYDTDWYSWSVNKAKIPSQAICRYFLNKTNPTTPPYIGMGTVSKLETLKRVHECALDYQWNRYGINMKPSSASRISPRGSGGDGMTLQHGVPCAPFPAGGSTLFTSVTHRISFQFAGRLSNKLPAPLWKMHRFLRRFQSPQSLLKNGCCGEE